jgi:hypothetical protein
MKQHRYAVSKSQLVLLSLSLSIFALACDSVSDGSGPQGDWLISKSEVLDGGPGKDGIPSIDTPRFAPVSQTSYVADDRRVVGIRMGNEVRAYPHQVLDWHEIVNDEIDGVPIALTFCPLTGTASAWNRKIKGSVTEFGVSGLLFRNNLIPYDRDSDSNWSQMQLRGVSGSNNGDHVETYQVVETTWETWKAMFPDSNVLTSETGFSRAYQSFAYGERYSTDPSQILFPIRDPDERLGRKERVFGIFPSGGLPKVYPLKLFTGGVRLIEDTIEGVEYIIVGSAEDDFVVAFEREPEIGGQSASFTAVQNALPAVLEDGAGNRWDIFGSAVSGPREGQRLQSAKSMTGYWFGWADFYAGLRIYEN